MEVGHSEAGGGGASKKLAFFNADAQSVVDIYLNYDCDLSLQNIFEQLISILSKIAQGRQLVVLGATPQQEKMLRARGVCVCVCVLLCGTGYTIE